MLNLDYKHHIHRSTYKLMSQFMSVHYYPKLKVYVLYVSYMIKLNISDQILIRLGNGMIGKFI